MTDQHASENSGLPIRRGALSEDGQTLRDEQGALVVINTTAQAVWELCDGTTSVPEMVQALSILFDASEQAIREDVTAALVELGRCGLVVQHGK